MPLSEIRSGMDAVWRTAVAGTEIEAFNLTIVGIAENFAGPKRSVILARATDDSQLESGPVSGMSGSPCYIDGKLIGAYAYGFAWPKNQTLIGITPIEDMLPIVGRDLGAIPSSLSGTQEEAVESARWFPGESTMRAASGPALGPPADGRTQALFAPVKTPMFAAGLSQRSINAFAGEFQRLGLELMQAPVGSSNDLTAEDLVPGAPVGAVLLNGDFNIAAVGTVTWRDEDKILAFGHPFFQSGNAQIPMAPASVTTIVQTMPQSFKLASVGPVVGTIFQDRLTAVAGELGSVPEMADLAISVTTDGETQSYGGQLFRHRSFSPLMAAVALLETLTGTLEGGGEQTFFVDTTITIDGFEPIQVSRVGTGQAGAMNVARGVYADLLLLHNNPFDMPDLQGIEVSAEVIDGWKYAGLESVQQVGRRLEPGGDVEVLLGLRNYHGDASKLSVTVPLPENLSGVYRVFIGDAGATEQLDRGSSQAHFDSFSDVVAYLRESRSNRKVYVRLLKGSAGVRTEGTNLEGLPPSVRRLMMSPNTATLIERTRWVSVWEDSIELEREFAGDYFLPLEI